MKRSLRFLCAAIACAALPPLASATVLTFDDIGADGAVPINYGGLDWSAGAWSVFGLPQPPFTAYSGSFRAASGFDATDAQTRIGFPARRPSRAPGSPASAMRR